MLDDREQLFLAAISRRAEDVPRDAEPAPSPAPPSHLDQRHVGQLGVRREDRRVGLGAADVVHPLPLDRTRDRWPARYVETRNLHQFVEQLVARAVQSVTPGRHQRGDDLLALPHNRDVEEGRDPGRVREHARPAGDHQRMTFIPLLRVQRDPGAPQRLHHVEIVEFVRQGEGEDRKVGQRTLRLHRDHGVGCRASREGGS